MIEAFAEAGVFRLRGVIVGTIAFQAYAGLLGVRLPNAAIRTGDVDLAQDYGVSVALNDSLDVSLIDVLKLSIRNSRRLLPWQVPTSPQPMPALADTASMSSPPIAAPTGMRPSTCRASDPMPYLTLSGLPAERYDRGSDPHAVRGTRECSVPGAVCSSQADCIDYAARSWRECCQVRQRYRSSWPSCRSARR